MFGKRNLVFSGVEQDRLELEPFGPEASPTQRILASLTLKATNLLKP